MRPWLARGLKSPAVPLLLGALLGVASFLVNLLRLLTYHSPAYDLGFFDQLCWRQTHGFGLTSSFTPYPFLGQHWEPLLGALCLPYHLAPSPLWLFGIGAIGLALAPLGAFLLARAWLGAVGWAPTVAAAATAASPLLARGALFDFHPELLSPALALTALWAVERRRWPLALACCTALALLKEDGALVVAGIGWIAWCAGGHRRGLALAAGGCVTMVVLVGLVMPAFRGGAAGDLIDRYAYLSGSSGSDQATLGGILIGLVRHPTLWAGQLASAGVLEALVAALLPLGLLPLLAGRSLLGVVPVLGLALLSANPLQAGLHLHYGLQVFPLLLATALLGWRRLRDGFPGADRLRHQARAGGRLPGRSAGWALGAGTSLLAVTALLSPLSGGGGWKADTVRGWDRREDVENVLARVPAGESAAATSNLVAQLSERHEVWEFPDPGAARWVVIDDRGGPTRQSAASGYERRRSELPAAGYHVVVTEGGVTLWTRP